MVMLKKQVKLVVACAFAHCQVESGKRSRTEILDSTVERPLRRDRRTESDMYTSDAELRRQRKERRKKRFEIRQRA